MSEENVEKVRRAVDEFQAGLMRGDPGAFFDLDFVADDYEWIFERGAVVPEPLVWRRREGFEEFIRIWTEDFDEWSIRVELIDAGDDRVVGLTHQSATGKGSGVPVELKVGQVHELEGGRMIRVTNYLSHAEALEAAGLSE
jgi:ketosteroid isomerase-like protein